MQLKSSLKIAVTGSDGQLGYQLVKKLSGCVHLKAFNRESLNISDAVEVERKLLEFAPDIIINAAAYTLVDKAEQDNELADAVNHLGAEYLARTAEMLDSIIIHVSTDYVFDGSNDSPYYEIDKTNPQNVYGKTKLAGELAVIKHCTKYIILRTSWVFGEHGSNFVKTMLSLAERRSELGVVNDQNGGPTYAGDIADAIINICAQVQVDGSKKWGIYNYSGMPYVSWYKFALAIFDQAVKQKLIDKEPLVNPITTESYPTPAKRPNYSMLECSKISQEFSIKPSDWLKALESLTLYK